MQILLATLWLGNQFAQSPEVHCVSVTSNGNITLNWEPSTNLSSVFVEYRIYSNNSGSFTQIGSQTNINNSLFIDAIANGNLGSVSYFVTTVYNNGSSDVELPAEDTVSSIFLNVANPGDGTATLQWNDIGSPISLNNGTHYYIYQENLTGSWSLIDSSLIGGTNYYRDTISVCNANLNYQIQLANNQGCQSLSSIDGDLFQDLIPPDAPVMNSASVDTTDGSINLSWNPSNAEDAEGYIVLQNSGAGWIIVDTVWGYNNNTFNYPGSNNNLLSEGYGIAAFDSCWSGVPSSPNTSPLGTPHYSIYLRNTYNLCAQEITLKWNSYINWDIGVGVYNVYRSVEGGAYNLQSSISNGDTTFTDGLINYGSNICYLIEAISADLLDTALSNISCRFTNRPPSPTFAYVQNVSVDDDEVEISFFPDLSGITREIEVLKSVDSLTNFVPVYLEQSPTGSFTFIDDDINPQSEIAYYKYVVRDSCLNEIITSNVSNNIRLTGYADSKTLVNLIQWNAYKNWNGNVTSYNIYRSVNGLYDLTPLASVPSSQLYYEDDVSVLLGTSADGEFCYYIEAVESFNSFGFSETSLSNEVCVTQEPIVYVPNAIYLGGYNNQWQPVFNMADYDAYIVRVYTRFGEVIFESSDPMESWDGTYKGSEALIGVYIYQLTFKAGDGENFDIRGTITVIK